MIEENFLADFNNFSGFERYERNISNQRIFNFYKTDLNNCSPNVPMKAVDHGFPVTDGLKYIVTGVTFLFFQDVKIIQTLKFFKTKSIKK